ncbi:DNA polymerase zeta processivity subunit-like [Rosa rugosa]|uniref:DNA polymerase zeta processivity subunit-like n=1 Tax=Rosa rugosa TaxID=74645 RepID=UPI002B410BA3|nr:DNA polymerase zeta processivity subunit-like [Rosa rugosa]
MDGENIPGPTSQTLVLPILPPCHGRCSCAWATSIWRGQHSQDETAQILVELLEVAITSIVFLKGIYPAGAFERRKYMNLVVHRTRHPELRDYIHSAVSGLLPFIKRLLLVVIIAEILKNKIGC